MQTYIILGSLESDDESLSELSDSGSEFVLSGTDNESSEQEQSEISEKPKGKKRVRNEKMWKRNRTKGVKVKNILTVMDVLYLKNNQPLILVVALTNVIQKYPRNDNYRFLMISIISKL